MSHVLDFPLITFSVVGGDFSQIDPWFDILLQHHAQYGRLKMNRRIIYLIRTTNAVATVPSRRYASVDFSGTV